MASDFTKEEELAIVQAIIKFNGFGILDKNLFWSHIKYELKTTKEWDIIQTYFVRYMIPKLESYNLLNSTQINKITNSLSSKIKQLQVDLNTNNENMAPLVLEDQQLNDTTFFGDIDIDNLLKNSDYNPPTPKKSEKSKSNKSNSEISLPLSEKSKSKKSGSQLSTQQSEHFKSKKSGSQLSNQKSEKSKSNKSDHQIPLLNEKDIKTEISDSFEKNFDFHDDMQDVVIDIKQETMEESTSSGSTDVIFPMPIQIKEEIIPENNLIYGLTQEEYEHILRVRVALDLLDESKYIKEKTPIDSDQSESTKSSKSVQKKLQSEQSERSKSHSIQKDTHSESDQSKSIIQSSNSNIETRNLRLKRNTEIERSKEKVLQVNLTPLNENYNKKPDKRNNISKSSSSSSQIVIPKKKPSPEKNYNRQETPEKPSNKKVTNPVMPLVVESSIRTQSESIDLDLEISDVIENQFDSNTHEIHHQNLFSYESLRMLSDVEFQSAFFLSWLARIPMNSNPKIFFNELTLNFSSASKKYPLINNPIDIDTDKIIHFLQNISEDLLNKIFISNWIAVCPESIEPLYSDFKDSSNSSIENNYNIKHQHNSTPDVEQNRKINLNETNENTSKSNKLFPVDKSNLNNRTRISTQNQVSKSTKPSPDNNFAIPSTSTQNHIGNHKTNNNNAASKKPTSNPTVGETILIEDDNDDVPPAKKKSNREIIKRQTQTQNQIPKKKMILYSYHEDKKIVAYLLKHNGLKKATNNTYTNIAKDILPERTARSIEARTNHLRQTGKLKQYLTQKEYEEYIKKSSPIDKRTTQRTQKNLYTMSETSSEVFSNIESENNRPPSKKKKLYEGT